MMLSPALAQLINPPSGKEFQLEQKFNPTFIAANKIKEIRCSKESKKDGEKIRSTQKIVVYQFEPSGQLSLISEIDFRLSDTAVTVYTYAGNRLQCEVKNDAAGMYSYCYTYGADGLPQSRNYGRTERSKNLMGIGLPSQITNVAAETYTHVRYEGQLHTTLHNSSGRPYIKEIRYYDENNYLSKYTQSYIMSSDRMDESYKYNLHGWLSERNTGSTQDDRNTYTYDQFGNMLEEEYFKSNTRVYRKEYVYEGKNMLLRAELQRDEAAQTILITNYGYKYW